MNNLRETNEEKLATGFLIDNNLFDGGLNNLQNYYHYIEKK